jgi:hypothetical protein
MKKRGIVIDKLIEIMGMIINEQPLPLCSKKPRSFSFLNILP